MKTTTSAGKKTQGSRRLIDEIRVCNPNPLPGARSHLVILKEENDGPAPSGGVLPVEGANYRNKRSVLTKLGQEISSGGKKKRRFPKGTTTPRGRKEREKKNESA